MLKSVEEVFDVKLSIAGSSPYVPKAHERSRTVTVPIAGLGELRLLETLSTKTLEEHLASVDSDDHSGVGGDGGRRHLPGDLDGQRSRAAARSARPTGRRGRERRAAARRGEGHAGDRGLRQRLQQGARRSGQAPQAARHDRAHRRTKREIARRVAHEIKNPLAPIRAAVETLRRLRARNDPAFDDYFDEATRTVLSEVHPHHQDRLRVHRVRSAAGASIRARSISKKSPRAPSRSTQPEAPTSRSDATPCPIIQADHDQLVQVLTNLDSKRPRCGGREEPPKVDVRIEPLAPGQVTIIGSPTTARGERRHASQAVSTRMPRASPTGPGSGSPSCNASFTSTAAKSRMKREPSGGAVFRVVLPVAGRPRPSLRSTRRPNRSQSRGVSQ